MRQRTLQKNPQISLFKITHPEILVVLYIYGHINKNIYLIIFVTTSNSAFKSRKQIYIHEIKIQKYHYFNQCIWRFAYHTSNHNYHEYKFIYYINANAAANNNNNNKVTGIAQLIAFSCANEEFQKVAQELGIKHQLLAHTIYHQLTSRNILFLSKSFHSKIYTQETGLRR